MNAEPDLSPSIENRPLVAVVSGRASGAIALVRLWGPGSFEVLRRALRPAFRGPLTAAALAKPRLGRLGAGLGDEVVAVRVSADPPEFEIQSHGGVAAVSCVIEALEAAGARRVSPEQWAAQEGSAIGAEALIDLARAETPRTAALLLSQHAGALEKALEQLVSMLPERPSEAATILQQLLQQAPLSRRLLRGWHLALAGRPNVGKSALLNALAGYERSIVTATAGTTRDVVHVRLAVDGWPVQIADTAGLRGTVDELEAEGVTRAQRQHGLADLVIVVLDRATPLTEQDRQILQALPGAVRVANKSDLDAAWAELEVDALAVSARRGDGLDALLRLIAKRLVPNPPETGAALLFRERHVQAAREALDAIEAGQFSVARAVVQSLLEPSPAGIAPEGAG